jgi:hypothetical protein
METIPWKIYSPRQKIGFLAFFHLMFFLSPGVRGVELYVNRFGFFRTSDCFALLSLFFNPYIYIFQKVFNFTELKNP